MGLNELTDGEPDWAIDDDDDENGNVEIIASKIMDGVYHVRECQPPNRECFIQFNAEGRMLFNGVDIETEAFMAYVGLLDMVEESPGKVIHIKNGDFV